MTTQTIRHMLWAMQKSGQHAIIRWICRQSPSAMHVNCVLLDDLEKPRPAVWYENGDIIRSEQIVPIDSLQYKTHTLLWSVEGTPVQYFNNWNNLVVVRDPLNLFASRKKIGTCNVPYEDKYGNALDPIQVYKDHIQDYKSNRTVGINFNYWFESIQYRKDIAEILRLFFTDAGLNDVMHGKGQGGASSFDRISYHGSAQKMGVLERYKQVDLSDLMDSELIEIAKKYFNIGIIWKNKRY